jgi:replication factor A1
MEQLAQKILDTGKITKAELDEKVQSKLNSLGGLISEEGALHIIANEIGVQLSSTPSSDVKVQDVSAGMRNVSVLLKVLKKYELRTFGADGTGKVASCYVGDETGALRLTFWNDKTSYFDQINENDVIEVQQAYSRENNGRVEIHMGNSAHCVINPEGKTVEVQNRAPVESPEKKLQDVSEDDTFVNITATIVQAYDPRFFPVDANNKRVPDDQLTGNESFNYVMNIFLDDSTHNMRATLWKEQIQQLMGLSNEDIIVLKDDPQKLEDAKTDLLGRIITARARVKKNEAYNNLELVLYNVNSKPSAPSTSTQSASSAPLSTTQQTPKVSESKPQEAQNAPSAEQIESDVSEELLGDDDEELLSIDDIDDKL